ncbi:MAG: 50S ribosomal protein L24 [Spirochaetales bacterium]|nr:50S ribosomal protein L24 [Spirochaetales bacterium]
MKLKKDDTVQVIAGKDKGKTGKILRINHVTGRVIVQNINIVKKAMRPKRQNEKGGIVEIEAPLNASKVMLVCKKCGKPTRVGYRFDADEKVRFCKKCGEQL